MSDAIQCASATAAIAASYRNPPFAYSIEQWRLTTNVAAVAIEGLLSSSSERENIEPEFNRLAHIWKSERSSTSSITEIALHPAYQQIIGLGKPAIPLILREMKKEPDFWFWALKAISRDDPVPAQSRGRIREMTAIWLDWGRRKGYAR